MFYPITGDYLPVPSLVTTHYNKLDAQYAEVALAFPKQSVTNILENHIPGHCKPSHISIMKYTLERKQLQAILINLILFFNLFQYLNLITSML